MSDWEKAVLRVPFIDVLDDAISGIDTAWDTYTDVLDTVAAVYRVIAQTRNFLDPSTSPVAAAIKKVTDELGADFFNPDSQSGAYVLNVPLVLPFHGSPDPPFIKGKTLDNIMLATGVRYAGDEVTSSGGNYGIYRKIVESIFDPKDHHKPKLSDDSYTGVILLVYGAKNFGESLKIGKSITTMFGDYLPLPPDVGQIPVPQNVKVRPATKGLLDAPSVDLGEGAGAARILWDPEIIYRNLNKVDPITFKVDAWHVYVKRDGSITADEDPGEYQILTGKVLGLPGEKTGVSIETMPDEVIVEGLDPDVAYHFSIGYDIEVIDKSVPPTSSVRSRVLDVEATDLSDQVRFRAQEQVPPRKNTRGTPPDWLSLKTPASIIPRVEREFDKIVSTAELVERNFARYSNELLETVDYVQSHAAGIATRINAVGNAISGIQDTLDQLQKREGDDAAGLWVTAFGVEGNRADFLNKIGDALLNKDLIDAPPFYDGDASLGALVIAVEGESPVDISPVYDPLKALFTGGSSNVSAEAIENIDANPVEGIQVSKGVDFPPEDLDFIDEDDLEDDAATVEGADIEDDPC